MIRTSCHTTKFLNTNKKENLSVFILEYRRATKVLVDYLWDNSYTWTYKNEEKTFSIKDNLLPPLNSNRITQENNNFVYVHKDSISQNTFNSNLKIRKKL